MASEAQVPVATAAERLGASGETGDSTQPSPALASCLHATQITLHGLSQIWMGMSHDSVALEQ